MDRTEEDLLPISGLQHMVYCDRQAALIHVDRVWVDNAFTVEGTHLHRVVDDGKSDSRHGMRTVRGIHLHSTQLGLVGKSDLVELHPVADGHAGVLIQGLGSVRWSLRPIEYKRGRPKAHRADEVQLCAQAICLEEHFGATIMDGSIFYGAERRRTDVLFDAELRRLTSEVAAAFHKVVTAEVLPVRPRDARCERCSLEGICMPPTRAQRTSAASFLRDWIGDQLRTEVTE